MTLSDPFLLSYPPPSWQIRGGSNFRSAERPPTNPQRAFREWLRLADALDAQGRQLVVMPPTELTGMVYTANSGAWFAATNQFVVSNMYVAHRRDEAVHIQQFLRGQLKWDETRAPHIWEGQADLTTLPGNKFLVSWGVRSVAESTADVTAWLGDAAEVLAVKLRDPYFHGDTCFSMLGDSLLMIEPTAMTDTTLEEIARFTDVELLEITEDDALAYACNGLCVDNKILMPRGISEELLDTLRQRDFEIIELDFDELFGKGGGGPRCLANVLHGFDPASLPRAVLYAEQRDALHQLVEDYPLEPASGRQQ